MSKIQHLLAIIDQLHQQHMELLKLSEAKRQVLVHNQLTELQQMMQRETDIVKRVATTEQQWVEAMKTYYMEQGLPLEPELTLTHLIEHLAAEEDKEALAQAQSRLLETMDALQHANQVNKQLIEQSLQFINYSLQLMTEPPEETTYKHPAGAHDTMSNRERGSMFDTRL